MISTARVQRVSQTANHNILEIAEQYVQLRRSGTHRCVALCIFHKERTPSLSFTLGRGFVCFGCGESGDALRFVMLAEGLNFPAAVRKLAARFDIPLDSVHSSRDDAERRVRAEAVAWSAYDEILRLRHYYTSCLHRCDRLCASIGKRLLRERNPRLWDSLARLAPAHSFFLAAFQFYATAKPPALARFASASPAEQRNFFSEACDDAATSAAA
jgi:hypothetical protein